MTRFLYVYILKSEAESQRFYTGLANDLRTRLKAHNSGRIVHTAKWRPWRLKTYITLSDRTRAAQLERYLKSASGRAFVSDICIGDFTRLLHFRFAICDCRFK